MSVEDQLRAAGRAVSDQVRDLPGLDLRTQPAARRAKARASRRWLRGGGWLIPIAAAATVVAVAVTLVAVKSPPRAAHQASAGPAASRSAASASAVPADPEALPRYFVAISGLATMGPLPPAGQSAPAKDPLPDSVIVGDTLTGARLATIKPPAGSTFVGVTGAADDGTFVLDSVQIAARSGFLSATQQRTWYLLRITPGATPPTTLTKLNFPVPAAADVNGIALSPDGTSLAVFYQLPRTGDGFPYSGPFTLAIYAVATGAALRTWTGTDPFHGSLAYGGSNGLPDSNSQLSWSSDGQRLAFDYENSKGPAIVLLREVNLAAPGGDLLADSAVIAKTGADYGPPVTGKAKIWCDSLGITGDGRSAVCGATLLTKPGPWTGCATPTDVEDPGIAEISLAGDQLTRLLYKAEPKCAGGGYATVLWSSPSGDTVLGSVSYLDDPSGPEHQAIVLYSHGRATTVNWPRSAGTLLANQVAF